MEQYDSKKIEGEAHSLWKEKQIPQGLHKHREGAKKFFLLDGPPYINGLPHVGHVKTTACKDVWTRYKYMQGFDCFMQPGFDCHGLPVEVVVQKELGVHTKKDIERIGIDKFDAACLQKILNNEKIWMDYYDKLGAWRAYFEPYFTYKNYYIESAWWTIKRLHEHGMLRQGETPTHWCPECETVLSGYEVSDSYKDVADPSVYLKFKLKGTENEYLLVWTTTPWTLPANVALFVHPKEKYVKAKVGNDVFILAKKLVERVLKEKVGVEYEIVGELDGSALEGKEYEPLVDVDQQKALGAKAHRVYASVPIMAHKKYKKHKQTNEGAEEFEEFVTMEDGTGIVHCAPGHGSTDYYVGVHYGLPAVSPVDEQGRFTAKANGFAGKFVKDADKDIVEWLDRHGKLLFTEKITHSYPLCWRCKTPLIFRMSKQWYLTVDYVKDKMLKANEETRWMPAFGKDAFRNWLENSTDWCISRQRYWAIPMPIWQCAACGRYEVIGSVDELEGKALREIGTLDDLHRHSIDKIQLRCPHCKGKMSRVPDVFDVWFDSGIAPWASLGYPHQNKELFESMFPMDLINESQDQIRGWFYTLLFAAMATHEKPAFKSVAMMGWVVDEKGEKMSKSQGNVIWANDGIEAIGADAIRLYYCWEIAPWDVQKFSPNTAKEVGRALNVYWNTFQFYETYKPHGFKPNPAFKPGCVEDKWIISRANTVAGQVAGHLENFEFHLAGRKLMEFILDDYSRWFVKLARDRMAAGDAEATETMRYCLDRATRLLAPICPFVTEKVYAGIGGAMESVHFENYPSADEALRDEKLEELMAFCQRATEAALALRKDRNRKLRWPVKKITVSGEKAQEAVKSLGKVLAAANNALVVEASAKPLAGGKEFDGGSVDVDVTLDAEVKRLALVREVARAVQASRKENGFSVSDRIAVEYDGAELEGLAGEVGATEAKRVKTPKGEHRVEVKIEELGAAVTVAYSKANALKRSANDKG
ncbi:isoleucine--tRNA ligase [Candidatus Micrarchaeota archaeon CG1_02_60_51]|nr:MAG: isoleucine--tRNA ligase [Candidatus Micrarchaeota archaeon CG1_02_60_51]PIY91646.1 MAG: isoleucine--tRNA ligase [Candidatus Micrarchaeota archaeon CG_4_10_14_0_8_um_filter_60_7]